MTPRRSFFDCLEAAAPQSDAVSFEPVGNQSCDVDASMEVAAFVERSLLDQAYAYGCLSAAWNADGEEEQRDLAIAAAIKQVRQTSY